MLFVLRGTVFVQSGNTIEHFTSKVSQNVPKLIWSIHLQVDDKNKMFKVLDVFVSKCKNTI